MSRSRKAPFVTDNGPHKRFMKKQANKRIRQKAKGGNVADNSGYKKEFESWSIQDFSFRDSSPKGTRK
jgi:hypothetical protein